MTLQAQSFLSPHSIGFSNMRFLLLDEIALYGGDTNVSPLF